MARRFGCAVVLRGGDEAISRALENGALKGQRMKEPESEGVMNVSLHRGRGRKYWSRQIGRAIIRYGESEYNPGLWERFVNFYALMYARTLAFFGRE